MQNTTSTSDFDLEAFALHCWRQQHQPLESIFEIMIATAPNVDLRALREQVAEAMMERVGTSDTSLSGKYVAIALNEAKFRNASIGDIMAASERALDCGGAWEESAVIAGLAEACFLGRNAVAAAWAYTPIHLRKHSATGFGKPAEDTGLPVPADEIALLMAGMCPITRMAIGANELLDALKGSSDDARSAVPLVAIARARERSRDDAVSLYGAGFEALLRACKRPYISPQVLRLAHLTFGDDLVERAIYED